MNKLLKIISEAEKNKVAIGHFNISNLEQFKAVSNVARSLDLPVIIGVSEGEREFIGVNQIRGLINSYNEEYSTKSHFIFLNADHTYSLDRVKEAAEAKYDMIVFDGTKLSFEENIKQTKEAVKIARKANKNILIEGELGFIGTSSKIREFKNENLINSENLTKSEDALRFVKETGINLLAPAVGNLHGMFKDAPEPRLDINRIQEIKKSVKIPLVLHGGSGNSPEDFISAIDAGISMIHISTELRFAWRKSLDESLKNNPNEIAPYKILEPVVSSIGEVIKQKLVLFSRV